MFFLSLLKQQTFISTTAAPRYGVGGWFRLPTDTQICQYASPFYKMGQCLPITHICMWLRQAEPPCHFFLVDSI